MKVALAGGVALGGFAVAAPDAKADLDLVRDGNQLVMCTPSNLIASLNPTIKDGPDAKYVKAGAKISDGTKTFLGGPIPADDTDCSVDAGIRTEQGSQDVKYVLDNQTNGHALLELTKLSASLTGSTQCDSGLSGPAVEYPNAYPLQGKLTYKFENQLDAKGKGIQMQTFIRTYTDEDDPGGSNVYVTGTVIKGPGVGGEITNAFTFLPTDSTKNVNLVLGCTDGEGDGDAVGAELWIAPADGVDLDVDPDAAMITISHDDANAKP
jgi:hypothetical protein